MNSDYRELPPVIDETIIERALQFGTAELCDGMKDLGIAGNGAMDFEIMPLDENLKMAGTAMTVDTREGDNFPIHVAIYSSKPGYVLVVGGKGCKDRAYLGDLMGGASKAIGLNGIVVDGCVRDRLGLKSMHLPVFSKGFNQNSPIKKGPGKINTPVECAGITVYPGDLVVGDCDGVTVVPRDRIEDVLNAAEAKLDYEKKRRQAIAEYEKSRNEGSENLPDLSPKWVKDMLENG